MADAAALYEVPIVGGHISEHRGDPALSAFAIGDADRVLSVTRARPGQDLVFACCLDGRMRADFAFSPRSAPGTSPGQGRAPAARGRPNGPGRRGQGCQHGRLDRFAGHASWSPDASALRSTGSAADA